MKVKRFFAPTMAAALKQVSEHMGPDAMILSNRRVDGGVEIVTALDYDENMARQRLGDKAVAATSGTHLAELQADQQRHLEDELGRSRDRIRGVRDQRADSQAGYGSIAETVNGFADMTSTDPFAEGGITLPAGADGRSQNAAAQSGQPAGYAGELAAMRSEISSLRELMSGQAAPAALKDASVGANVTALQQRLAERLGEFGLSRELSDNLARRHQSGRLEDGWKQSLKMLVNGVRTSRQEWLDEGGVFALVGPTGAGKTTTIGKLAARYVLRHGADSLALITTDRYRVAAHEQLFVFGRILNVPVRVVDESHPLDEILDELSDRHLVLIDTAGLTSTDRGYQEQLAELARSHHKIRTHLVVSATSQPRIMKSVWHCYKMANLAGCVITKIDEALTLGEALGFVMETSLPMAWYTDGQKIPQDLHPAKALALVQLGVERMKDLRQKQAVATGS